jgi:hypothetical protein
MLSKVKTDDSSYFFYLIKMAKQLCKSFFRVLVSYLHKIALDLQADHTDGVGSIVCINS